MPTLDFVTVIERMQQTVQMDGPLWMLVSAICWMMAFVFGFVAVMQLKAASEDGRNGFRAPIMTFLAAVLMASSPTFLQSILVTTYGSDVFGKTPLSYVVNSGDNKAFGAVLSLVSFVGYCFFVRGIWILRESGEPQRFHSSTVGQALAMLGAGMAAIYIDITLKLLSNTFGWDISTYIGG